MFARLGPFLLALLAGLAQAQSIAALWDGQPRWWLQVLSLAVLPLLLRREESWRRAAGLGLTFAAAWLASAFWWLFISMHVYGGLPALMAVVAVLALAAFLGLYYALACGLYVRLAPKAWYWQGLLFAALWLGAELLRATWFTGFPWGAGGYAHVEGPLAFLAPVLGVYGIGFIAGVLAFALALLGSSSLRRSWRYWLGVGSVLGLLAACNMVAALPPEPAAPGARISVALLQGNIPQDEKFERGSGIPMALDWYGHTLIEQSASLVIAPETAIPLLPQQLPEGYLEAIDQRFQNGDQAALVGVPLGSFSEGYTNSVVGLKPGAEGYRYDKHHLVPFGEFIPPLFRWFTELMNIPLGDFNRGNLVQPPFEWRGQRIAPNICYEDLFGEELAANFADSAAAPTILVNVSNIAWFGNTVAIDQHLNISRMRALEFRRPMIRATNTGATVIIDRHGRVTHELPRHTRGVLVGEVEGGQEITPFARWAARLGLLPLWGVVLLAAGLAWWRRPRTA